MKTIVLGASNNTHRYSYLATVELLENGHEVIPVGIKKASINDLPIRNSYPEDDDVHTVAMYLSAENQEKYYDVLLKNPPKRVIFNPGTHNPFLEVKLKEMGVDVLHSCVLIMLSNNQY